MQIAESGHPDGVGRPDHRPVPAPAQSFPGSPISLLTSDALCEFLTPALACLSEQTDFEPVKPLTDGDVGQTLKELNELIAYRLRLIDIVPAEMANYRIGTFSIPSSQIVSNGPPLATL